MKRHLSMLLVLLMLMPLVACGGNSNSASNTPNQAQGNGQQQAAAPSVETPPIADLSGEWVQDNKNSEDSYHVANISENTIEIYWYMDGGETVALYWAGSFEAPTSSKEPYSWDSKNDHDRTDVALLASGDDTKTFTYENGVISYTASAMGVEMTVKMKKDSWGYESAASGNSDSNQGNQSQEGSGTLGDYFVEIKGATLGKDYHENPIIVITYAWTNNSEETKSAMWTMSEKAFQDGVQIDTAIVMDSDVYDSSASMKEVRPGTTIDVQCAFVMTSDSIVEFELSELISFSSEMVSMNFDPATL